MTLGAKHCLYYRALHKQHKQCFAPKVIVITILRYASNGSVPYDSNDYDLRSKTLFILQSTGITHKHLFWLETLSGTNDLTYYEHL
jgi:hypothetical protein